MYILGALHLILNLFVGIIQARENLNFLKNAKRNYFLIFSLYIILYIYTHNRTYLKFPYIS